jgi:hypothetical protein
MRIARVYADTSVYGGVTMRSSRRRAGSFLREFDRAASTW